MSEFIQQDIRTLLLCIDSYDNDIPVGRFVMPCLEESGTFRSLSQMLIKIDRCLDIQNEPQAFCDLRSFSRPVVPFTELPARYDLRPGSVASFRLQFLFRKHASWQGTVTWQETNETAHFRSALELIYLINSAAQATAWVPGYPSFRALCPELRES